MMPRIPDPQPYEMDAAVTAAMESLPDADREAVKASLMLAWPYLHAASMRASAALFNEAFNHIGHGNDPLFVLASLSSMADDIILPPEEAEEKEYDYSLQILEEPQERPILLTQEDFDLIVDAGLREHVTRTRVQAENEASETRAFATVETLHDEGFQHHGKPLDDESASQAFGRGLEYLLRLALHSTDEPRSDNE